MIEWRVLAQDDWARWRVLRLAALADAPLAFGSQLEDWQGQGDREERWRARLSIAGSYNVVAMLDGEAVGMASGIPTDQEFDVELISMWVAPGARGCGVGDGLLREVERWAQRNGGRVLRLAVAPDNHAASTFYLRNGFTYTGELGDPTDDGRGRERLMAKDLSGELTTL